MCQAVEEDPVPVEAIWLQTERQRFLARGYPPPLAEFWALCARAGYAEKLKLEIILPHKKTTLFNRVVKLRSLKCHI